MSILLTGSTGFLGSSLCKRLDSSAFQFRPVVRLLDQHSPNNAYVIGDINGNTDYGTALAGINTVIHAAARVHVMKEDVTNSLEVYRQVNVEGTRNLARQAAIAGVKRFIFISSVKVCGEATVGNIAYEETMSPAPEDLYGQSKYEAEQALIQIASETGMEFVIVRPPLVYGPRVKANFHSLLRLSSMLAPLPFGSINNQRSMIYLGNLVDFIVRCIDHPKAANQTFLIADGQDLSLASLIRIMRRAMNKPVWLIPVPVRLFKLTGKLTGKMALVDRLIGDLKVDTSKARKLLGWMPPYTVEEGIAATVQDFKNRNK